MTYTLAARARRRAITRTPNPPATIPAPWLATIWPPAHRRLWWPVRTTWNTLRTLTARLWPTRWHGYHHPHAWHLGRTLWAIAALTLLAVSAAAVAGLVAVWPLWWVTSRLAGSVLVLAGWTPPLDTRHLTPASVDTAELREPPVPIPAAVRSMAEPGGGDPWDWNHTHDPHLAAQRDAIAEMRRANDLAAQQLHTQHQPLAPPAPAPMWAGYPTQAPPIVPYNRPPAPTPAQAQAGRTVLVATGRGPWWAAKTLLWFALVLGSIFTLAAWALAFASSLGVIQPPPTFDQLQTTTPPAITTPDCGASA